MGNKHLKWNVNKNLLEKLSMYKSRSYKKSTGNRINPEKSRQMQWSRRRVQSSYRPSLNNFSRFNFIFDMFNFIFCLTQFFNLCNVCYNFNFFRFLQVFCLRFLFFNWNLVSLCLLLSNFFVSLLPILLKSCFSKCTV